MPPSKGEEEEKDEVGEQEKKNTSCLRCGITASVGRLIRVLSTAVTP